ncbi:MAG: hypothetical protein A2408_03030 [Candidatus Yonathbacteria bacterium RIFOXYC1_FULL_52_10]|uniref:Uncharacterized protein n=1 Tax=Candidatus Yonathbacteria bacterium RIFOXYD1_FULL_52_36 TaxID=1802730 RepID=A0A1G2SHU5_9BACT|nr:MAG: hypothetical protein A2408_03030 [Candidatus Yonathbacteria bacterium RIFOXYC1_FULL_52_10]OHA84653.1 MAG: hypothetical protein A2591_02930 [Candidatus Yonathbacteria bacterium RIFOXYD1_FULL_52_36]
MVTLEALLGCIAKKNLPPEKAWLIVTAHSVMKVTKLPDKGLSKTPLAKRLHGFTSYVRVDELLDLVCQKFKHPLSEIRISPLVRTMPDGSIQTDIRIDVGNTTMIPNAKAFQMTAELV